MRRYPSYKNSGVEWLGNVPEHWDVDRLRWTVLGCKNGIWGNEPDGVDDLVCVRVADFDRTKFRIMIDEPTVRAVTPGERRGRLLQQGDLLLEKSGGGELQPVGAVMLFEHDTDAVCSNFVARMLVSDGFNSVFLTYLHAHLYASRVNTRSIKQTTGIQNLDSMAYLDERVACPPSIEQRTIADFLDRRTSEIDELIAKKERVIELLREKRTAIISHAVTKGLDPDAKMKDSGIDWLGEIPEHWEMKRFKNLGAIIGGYAFKSDLFTTSGIRTIKINNIQQMEIDWSDTSYIPEYLYEQHKSYSVTDGSLVFALTRPIISTGIKAAIVKTDNEKILINQRTGLFRPNGKATESFLYYMVNSQYFTFGFSLKITSTNQPNISPEDIGRIYITLPSKKEQQEIADHLDRETSKIDVLIAKVTEAIEKLKEYRTALISAAVTGKIKVN